MHAPLPRLLLVAGLALAGRSWAAGVNLSWDACTSESGVQNKTFACDTNTGTLVMYGSFTLAADQPNFVAIEATVDIHAENASLPDWWQFLNGGACRQNAMSTSFDFSGDSGTSCHDPWTVSATGAAAGYHTYWTTPPAPSGNANDAQVLLIAAVPSTSPQYLVAGTEYYGFKMSISLAKTVGTGSCLGCDSPVCLTLSQVKAVGLDNSSQLLTDALSSATITWQSASSCPGAFRSQDVTWGRIRTVLR